MKEEDSVSILKGIGEKSRDTLASMGILTVGDLLHHYPLRYDSYDEIRDIDSLREGETVIVCGRILSEPKVWRSKNMTLTSVVLGDETGELLLTWFRMPYLKNSLRRGEQKIVRGKISRKRNQLVMDQPTILGEEEYEEKKTSLQPVYLVSGRISVKMMSKLIRQALDRLDLRRESLPESLRKDYGLSEWNFAIRQIHFPDDRENWMEARKRLVFEEFLVFLLAVRRLKGDNRKEESLFSFCNNSWSEKVLTSLPYDLTGAQKRVWQEIQTDMRSGHVMNRLIQGDVGSGKTILAILTLLMAAENGYQGAMMAPTEVLARQHYDTWESLRTQYDIPIRCCLLTGSMTAKQKREAYDTIASHQVDVILGTHALIQEKVVYDHLAVVVTDEQHRFGVHHREQLLEKGERPHVLVMSATPIPRTLAMILYGDLDISVVDELPAARLPIKNCVVNTDYREKAYRFITNQVEMGRQVYVICSMVEESEGMEAENVLDYTEMLRRKLPSWIHVEYLHGKMKPKEKNKRMEEFAAGSIHVLVSTTVVEVGVNVPNATVMMVENAER
ncbi:MAG: ATP-dependent DNA helicase RecG, partial [Clostridiales bacterium]|nr:ATP-dependent DNA helicase RecG [Clostridiales bacterium]